MVCLFLFRQNEGKWKCEARNKLGSISHVFEVYAKEETDAEGSGIDFDPDIRSPRLPYDPLVADHLSSSGRTNARKNI